jgi:hypothetical protein
MKCKEIKLVLPDYARGKIDPPVRDQVEKHLAGCSGCSSEAREIQGLFVELGAIREVPPNDLYWNTILPRIHERLSDRSPSRSVVGNLVPVALTLSVMFIFLFLFRIPADTSLQGLRDTLQKSPPDEIQMISDQQTVSGITEAVYPSEEQELQANIDNESITHILADKQPVFSTDEEESYISLDNLSDQEIKVIVADVDLSVKN